MKYFQVEEDWLFFIGTKDLKEGREKYPKYGRCGRDIFFAFYGTARPQQVFGFLLMIPPKSTTLSYYLEVFNTSKYKFAKKTVK